MTQDERIVWWLEMEMNALQEAFSLNQVTLIRAVESMTHALIQDHKILVCGHGDSAANAQALVSMLTNRYHRERPAFPAILLAPDLPTFSAIISDASIAEVFARPLRAIGKAGDILICLFARGQASNILQAIEAAHEHEIQVIALTGSDARDMVSMLREPDISISVPSKRHMLINNIHLSLLHCMMHLLDEQLFGEEDYSEHPDSDFSDNLYIE